MSRRNKNRQKNIQPKKSEPKTKHERREDRRESLERKEKFHAAKRIPNPNDLVCPWCLHEVEEYESRKVNKTYCAIWEIPRKPLGNWAEGTIMCDYHQIRVYPNLWFKTLKIVLDVMPKFDDAEKNRIYFLEIDKYKSIKALEKEKLKEIRESRE